MRHVEIQTQGAEKLKDNLCVTVAGEVYISLPGYQVIDYLEAAVFYKTAQILMLIMVYSGSRCGDSYTMDRDLVEDNENFETSNPQNGKTKSFRHSLCIFGY